MTLWLLVRRSLWQHRLSTVVTAASVALAGGLWLSVWTIKDQANDTFAGLDSGFDAVLGARGSSLQLVLNSVFHLEASPGNLPQEDYRDIRDDARVAAAIPIAVGDNYRGYRLVGVTTNLFTDIEYRPGQKYRTRYGRWFDPLRKEAVVGSFAARRLKLKPGDTFHPYHGLVFDEKTRHQDTYVVVSVLEPTNTPADRVIWIPLAGLQRMDGHDPAAVDELSAVLLKLRSAQAGFHLDLRYNKQGNRLTLAWPIGRIVAQLFEKFSWFSRVLELIAYLVALVAVGSVLTGIYNSMNGRRRDIAILRALGARRQTIFSAVVLESVAIAALGMAAAFLIYWLVFSAVAAVLRSEVGVVLSAAQWHPVMLWAPISVILMSALAGSIPAIKAYRTNVAENLAPIS